MATPYPIPRTLWESLDAVLFTKGNSLAREIAAELKVNPQPLLQALKAEEHGKFTILPDDDSSTYQCQASIPNGAAYIRCRCPVLSGARFCSSHEKSAPIIPAKLEEVQRVEVHGEIYLKKAGELVLNREGRPVGHFTANQKLLLFECED